MGLRIAALIAGIVAPLNLLAVVANSTAETFPGMNYAAHPWVVTLLGASLLVTLTQPAFYLALAARQEALPVERVLRAVALAAALAVILLTASSVPSDIRAFTPDTVIAEAGGPWTAKRMAAVLSPLANLTLAALLVVLSRQPDPEPETPTDASRTLRSMTAVAAAVWGIIVAAASLGLLVSPYMYKVIRDVAAQYGRTPPPYWSFLADRTWSLVSQACVFAVPFVVWRSIRRRPAVPAAPLDDLSA